MYTVSKFAFSLLLALTSFYSLAQQVSNSKDSVIKMNPPFQQFYAKYLNSGGIPIRSSAFVSDSAFFVANRKINEMLQFIPIIRNNLMLNGFEFHIIGKNEQTSDLPEFNANKGVQYKDNGILTDIDKRTRGMGGIYASCGEENLLKLSGDKYGNGYDILLHEFAHSIMDFGMDSILRNKIIARYQSAMTKGLWKCAYAATNAQEYWAELSSWYFGAHGDMLPNGQPKSGPIALKAYDDTGYILLDSIYKGKLISTPITKKSRIVAPNTSSGVSIQKSKLIIINNSLKKLKVSRIDEQGKAVFIENLLPSTVLNRDTFYSVIWLIEGGVPAIYIQVFDPICNIELSKDY